MSIKLTSSSNPGLLLDPLYTPPEAANYLGVNMNTLSVWRCSRRYGIQYIKVGRLVRYRKSALDAFIASRTLGCAT